MGFLRNVSQEFSKYTFWALLYHSEENTHFAPKESNANLKPPMPENKSMYSKFLILFSPPNLFKVIILNRNVYLKKSF